MEDEAHVEKYQAVAWRIGLDGNFDEGWGPGGAQG